MNYRETNRFGPQTSLGMDPRLERVLAYAFFWVSGIILFFVERKDRSVRWHAAQSMVVFGGLHIISIALGIFFGAGMMFRGGFGAFGMGAALYGLINLVGLVLWILLMVKAYQHEKFEVPIAGGIAKSFSGS